MWGFDLAQDIKDYRAGLIQWSDIDRGLVLAGPPGLGKTIFAKALAKTCGVNFIPTSVSRWESKQCSHLGEVVKILATQFDEGLEQARCIMLIDEIDTLPDRDRVDHRAKT